MPAVCLSKYVAASLTLAGVLLTVESRSGSAVSAIELPQLQTTENTSEYVLTSKDNAPELGRELERLRGSGHRIAFGDAAYGVVIAGKSGNPSGEYRVLADLRADLATASAEGFRVLGRTVGIRSDTPAAVLERVAAADRFEYNVIVTKNIPELQRDVASSVSKGYALVALASSEGPTVAVMERLAGSTAPAPSSTPVLLVGSDMTVLQQQLSEHGKRGYRVRHSATGRQVIIALEASSSESPQEILLISTTRHGTLGRDIDAAAAKGFAVVPDSMGAFQKRLLMKPISSQYFALMERDSSSARRQYLVLGARRLSTLGQELREAGAKGYSALGFSLGYNDQDTVIILESATASVQ